MMKKLVSVLLAVLMLLSCTASLAEGKVLHFATSTEPNSLDPQLGNGVWITNVTGAIFEGLLRRYNHEIIPGIAETYELENDGVTYTFHLREAYWTDGVAVTAQTFVDSWNLLISRATPMSQFTEHFAIDDGTGKKVANATALDDYTLQVVLNKPVPFMTEVFAMSALAPVRVDLYEQYGDAYYQSVPLAMNGPFILKKWNPNDVMELVPNPTYWNASAVNFDEVDIYTVSDSNTQANMYESGELDLLEVPNTMYADFESKGMMYYENGSTFFIQFTTNGSVDETAKWLANRDFIEAISYCIDREDYVLSLYGTVYTPTVEFIPPSSTGYNGTTKGNSGVEITSPFAIKADYDKAQQKLDAAVAVLGELPAEFTLVVNDNAINQQAAQYIQDVCTMIGVNLRIDTIPRATFWATLREGYRYDFLIAGSGPDVDDASTFLDVYDGKGLYADRFMRWQDDEYAQLKVAAWAAATPEERTGIMVQMENLLLSRGPIIPMYFTRAGWMLRDGFVNINRNMTGADLDYVFGDYVK